MDDYIKRSDVLKLARIYYTPVLREDAVPVTAIRNIPSEDVSPVRMARWKTESVGYSYCSLCNEQSLECSNFCPNCGADMRKDGT